MTDASPRVAASSLPSGTVTFLLTDIEGSTRAWQAAPEDLAEPVRRHYEILDRWIAAHGGARPMEQGEGDSVVAVFTDPLAAVLAAVDAQIELRSALPSLPVRMAVHTGDALLRDANNYVGLTVIRCARLRACAHGGQILMSAETRQTIGARLGDGLGALDLGRYGLKGLAGRTHVWQVLHPRLEAEFPPLNAGASADGNLPRRISSFIGRRAELASVTALLAEHRLVTIAGGRGVGKSRLALAAATTHADALPGGAWWVPLADLGGAPAGRLAEAVTDALSLERSADPVADVVRFFGSVAASLLVLDGADGDPGGLTLLIERLLASGADTRVVVTRREPLAVAGETIFRVAPFTLPEGASTIAELERSGAGELFLTRLREAGGDARDSDVATIVRICARLRGTADIEMAAIRAASTPPSDLLAELERMGQPARPDDLLASSVRWHLQSLAPSDLTVLTRLAMFRRPFELDAGLTVASGEGVDPGMTATAIRELTNRRLLTVVGDRVGLADRVKDAVEGRGGRPVADGPPAARYAEWFATIAEAFAAGGPTVPTSVLAADLADILHAVELSCAADLPEAYRLIVALAPRWPELDRWDDFTATARWLSTRSPSDGELAWVAAVARTIFAASAIPTSPIHALHDEAAAIAALDHDDESAVYLDFGAAAGALQEGDDRPATALLARGTALGVDPVVGALAAMGCAP